jgi:2-methylcitrate dehydratase PrpD
MALANKVEVREDKDITARGAKFRHMVHAEVHLNDGAVMKRSVEAARGSEKKFASDADVVQKFEKLASKTLPKVQVEKLRDAMLGLEKLQDAAEIARLMTRA